VSGNTPSWVSKAQNLGAADTTQTIDPTVWLTLHNEGQLQKQLHDLYTPGSGSYHQWMSQNQFNTSHSPTAHEVKSVSGSSHHFGKNIR
jgi:subtilase family serine protease